VNLLMNVGLVGIERDPIYTGGENVLTKMLLVE
jgi:hypothetical protein